MRRVLSSVTFFPLSTFPSRVCNQKQKTCLGNGLERNLFIAILAIKKIRSLDKIRIFSLPRQKKSMAQEENDDGIGRRKMSQFFFTSSCSQCILVPAFYELFFSAWL
jgi:hypothetical protein